MRLFAAGISYKTAPVELREQIAVSASTLACHGCWLKMAAGLSEVVVLSTCNRVEIYGVAEENYDAGRLFALITRKNIDLSPYVYNHRQEDAIRHLLTVVSGLDSMVLGETEINGQAKQAYDTAQKAGLTGALLNRLFQTAFQTAKHIRSKTRIGCGAVSVGSAAVELADKIFGGNIGKSAVMILGAGKMGEACVRHLAKRKAASVLVSNRSAAKAVELAAELGGRAVPFEHFADAMAEVDIVVVSTGSANAVVTTEEVERVMKARKHRPLFLVDIAVPRNVSPEVQYLENVYLYNIDHLQSLVDENLREREHELAACRRIIEEKTTALMARFNPGRPNIYDPDIQSEPRWVFRGVVACHS